MKTTVMIVMISVAVAVLAVPAAADVVVLNNGQYATGKISPAGADSLKLTTEYGDQFFPRSDVAGYFATPQGMEAEGFFQAGKLLLSKGKRDKARELFEACVKYDATYRDKCSAALRAAAAEEAAARPSPAVSPGTAPPAVTFAQPQVRVVRIQCPGCSGSGKIMVSSAINPDRGTERPWPCPVCGGKGYKEVQIRPGYELCPSCGGFGATLGSGGGSSDKKGFTSRKEVCPRCAGSGLVQEAWKPAEGTGMDTSGNVMMVSSPSPGTAPSRPMSATERAKSVASGGPAGRAPSREVGPSGIRPVSPMVIEEAASRDEGQEEVVGDEEGVGGSAGSDTEETTEKKESKEDTDTGEYTPPGVIGWMKTHRLYIILGAFALIVFAIAFSKMSGKK